MSGVRHLPRYTIFETCLQPYWIWFLPDPQVNNNELGCCKCEVVWEARGKQNEHPLSKNEAFRRRETEPKIFEERFKDFLCLRRLMLQQNNSKHP